MSLFQIVVSSFRHHWRVNLSVALGVAAATAVLVGALIIGDSVRGSLRHLVLDRLGKIDELLLVDRFFRQELASELAANQDFKKSFASATSAILFPAATVQTESLNGKRLAAGVLVVGSGPEFWDLEAARELPKHAPQ